MNGQTPIVITDLRIPFFRLVLFFIKVGLAAIPAAIVVGFLAMLIVAIITVAMGGYPEFVIRRWAL